MAVFKKGYLGHCYPIWISVIIIFCIHINITNILFGDNCDPDSELICVKYHLKTICTIFNFPEKEKSSVRCKWKIIWFSKIFKVPIQIFSILHKKFDTITNHHALTVFPFKTYSLIPLLIFSGNYMSTALRLCNSIYRFTVCLPLHFPSAKC